MRLFLAIELPHSVKSKLERQLEDLKKKYPQFTWVPTANFHITIHFFGEVVHAKELIQKIEGAIYDAPSFYLYSLNADLFMHQKIVLFVGFHREKNLEALVAKINREFLTNEKERFVPHLTIGRTKIPSKQQYFVLKKKLESLPIEIEFPVKHIHLYQSILGGKQPVYKKVYTFSLLEEEK